VVNLGLDLHGELALERFPELRDCRYVARPGLRDPGIDDLVSLSLAALAWPLQGFPEPIGDGARTRTTSTGTRRITRLPGLPPCLDRPIETAHHPLIPS
jgi:hypothetical protein